MLILPSWRPTCDKHFQPADYGVISVSVLDAGGCGSLVKPTKQSAAPAEVCRDAAEDFTEAARKGRGAACADCEGLRAFRQDTDEPG
ncbi:hypothetical protein Arth_3196 [Arthrobacter sp. FB24]|nr:hypothetical protein Arth_3196 [Arthrobacter sp. FB24]